MRIVAKLCFGLSLAAWSFVAAAASTAAPTAKSVAEDARGHIKAADFTASGRLVQVAPGGERTTYNFTLKAHWFLDGLRMLCEITAPASAKVRLLLAISADGRETIEVGKPGDKKPEALPYDKWGDSLLGTYFSFEDLADGQFFWPKQTLLPDAKYGARDCIVLRSDSGPGDRTHYATVTSWIDKRIDAVVHMEKTAKSSTVVKQLIYYNLRQEGGVWSASQVEAKVQGSGGSSLLIIERGSADAHLERKDFDAALLIKP